MLAATPSNPTSIRILLCVVGMVSFASSEALALSGPYYSYARIYADGGHVTATGGVGGGLNTVTNIQADESAQGTGPLHLEGGARWFCPDTDPTCNITLGSGAGLGWAEATTDPVNGTVGVRDGAFHVGGGPVPLRCVDFMGSQICQPVTNWGHAVSEASIRQAFVVGSDGSLAPGDPVTIQADLLLQGMFTDDPESGIDPISVPNGHIDAALLLSLYDPTDPNLALDDFDYLDWGLVEDIMNTPVLAAELETSIVVGFDSTLASNIDHSEQRTIDVAVGDVIVLDLVMRGIAVLQNDDEGGLIWAEFDDTLGGSLTPLTAGATLAPIPEPSTALLLGLGMSGMALLRRRR